MKIKLSTEGRPGHFMESRMSGDNFLTCVLGTNRIRYAVGAEMINTGFTMPASPLIQATFYAFSQHIPLHLEPAYFWMTIVQEVATMVKQDPSRFASVFNGNPHNKRLVKVICDELWGNDSAWPIAIGRFREELAKETGPAVVEGFFPHFSGDDETRELAYLVSVMDAASPFYKYEVHTRCGIPEIDLGGSLEDWGKLWRKIVWLEETFGMCEYFSAVKAIVNQIGRQVKNNLPDRSFWESIFKYENESGGEKVNGWITSLYAFSNSSQGPILKENWGQYQRYSINVFPSGMSVVPFIWQVMEERIPMRFFAGLTGLQSVNGYLTPTIGYGVIEGEK